MKQLWSVFSAALYALMLPGGEPLAAVAEPSHKWVLVSTTNESDVFIDLTSIGRAGKYIVAVNRFAHKVPVRHEEFEYRSSIGTAYYNCEYGSWAPKQTLYYSDLASTRKNGESIYQEDELKFRFPSPGSVGETLLRRACSHAGAPIAG